MTTAIVACAITVFIGLFLTWPVGRLITIGWLYFGALGLIGYYFELLSSGAYWVVSVVGSVIVLFAYGVIREYIQRTH